MKDYLLAGERAGSPYALGAPRRIPLGAAGMRQGGRSGSSLEFKEHRDYQPGDDLRHIDWNAYARSDQLAVKLFHEEVNPHLDMVVDGSRSMALAGSKKGAAVLGLAAFFATAADNAGFSHRLWLAGDSCEAVLGGNERPAFWGQMDFDYRGNPAESFARRPPAWRPRGIRLLLSDLFWMGDPLQLLGPSAERASAVVVIQVLADGDLVGPQIGNLRLLDVETDEVRDIFVDVPARKRYADALARHQQNWERTCRQLGATFTTVIAEELVEDWRLDDLVAAEILKVI